MISGSARREIGRLLPMKVESGIALRGQKEPGQSDVAKNLVSNRERVQDRMSELDMGLAGEGAHWDMAY
jgi:hypothetical protein